MSPATAENRHLKLNESFDIYVFFPQSEYKLVYEGNEHQNGGFNLRG